MIRVLNLVVCMAVLTCWTSAIASADSVTNPVQKKPLSVEEMRKLTSNQLMMRSNATAEEDYQAGLIALGRQEFIEAQEMFARAAKKGHTGAMVQYANVVLGAGFNGEAMQWYKKAAQLGDPAAQYSLAAMYLDLGNYDIKSLSTKIDPVEARKWMLKSAEQGYSDAVISIYMAFVNGGMGFPDAERTDAEKLKWIHKAIDLGNGTAMDDLSKAYREGLYGLPVDKKLADEWAAKARIAYGIKDEQKPQVKRKQRL